MLKQALLIQGIPAILWGCESERLLIAVHGNKSSKDDDVIKIVAESATERGYRVLSFDLPEHGDRRDTSRICDAPNCVEDLSQIMNYARTVSKQISVFGCSIGAYFAMLAYQDEPIRQALFLSPVVDMKRLILNMMLWFNVSEERLKAEQQVETPISTLYWSYYQYVLNHPVKWDKPTAILYGEKDELCEFEHLNDFAERCHASLSILEDGVHFFHTEAQLSFLRNWLGDNISDQLAPI